ncbi:MAG: hypothetical protein C0404_10515 [Verrucomicrobia bacterium]|nr:hypothetical protein [Verrucomicrobiota bacterium]
MLRRDDSMAFSDTIREEVLVKSHRRCCVCHEFAGRNVNVHHITQEADDGSNTLDNAIALCLRCHAEAGHYNPRHPLGTKYSPEELRKHRDQWWLYCEKNAADPESTGTSIQPVLTLPNGTVQLSEDAKEVRRIVSQPITDVEKARLRTIIYGSTDPIAQIEGISVLLAVSRSFTEDTDDMLTYCDTAVTLAEQIGSKSGKAEFLALKAVLMSDSFTLKYEHYGFTTRADETVGFPSYSSEEYAQMRTTLVTLGRQYEALFKEALAIANEINDVNCMARVLLYMGQAVGRRYIAFAHLGEGEKAGKAERETKECLIAAKNLFASIGDEVGAANALHNLANNLRNYGEIAEAKALTAKVLETTRKNNDFRLEHLAKILMERLETGTIPNYSDGAERVKRI